MTGEVSRRSFLKYTALTAVAVAGSSLLTGCGASSKNMAADTASFVPEKWATDSAAAAEEWGYDTPAEAPAETETAWDDAADTGFTTSAAGNAELDTGDNSSLSDYAAKIIYSANISAETTKFDEAVARIEAMVASYQGFVERAGNANTTDMIMATLLVALVLEASRRVSGNVLSLLSLVFIAYGLFGRSMPGMFMHRGYDWTSLSNHFFAFQPFLFRYNTPSSFLCR